MTSKLLGALAAAALVFGAAGPAQAQHSQPTEVRFSFMIDNLSTAEQCAAAQRALEGLEGLVTVSIELRTCQAQVTVTPGQVVLISQIRDCLAACPPLSLSEGSARTQGTIVVSIENLLRGEMARIHRTFRGSNLFASVEDDPDHEGVLHLAVASPRGITLAQVQECLTQVRDAACPYSGIEPPVVADVCWQGPPPPPPPAACGEGACGEGACGEGGCGGGACGGGACGGGACGGGRGY